MMLSVFKKPKIVFECGVPGVEKIMPIIPAKEYKHEWVGKALDDYKRLRQDPDFGTRRLIHITKCPGIFNFMRQGWIMRTWQDVVIETNGDGDSFTWEMPMDQKHLSNGKLGEYVSYHNKADFYDYLDNWKPNTLKSIVKIVSPWTCVVPKGYYLVEMPVVYADENRFTTAQGVFTSDDGVATLNPQLFWHVLNGRTLLKAGTPIAQYILVKKEQFDMELKAEESDIHRVDNIIKGMRFVTNRYFTKSFYR